MNSQSKNGKEEVTISADDVVAKIRELINEGNVRRISIRNEEGRTLLEVPLTTGSAVAAAAVIFNPVLAAIGALAALAVKLTIVIERVEQPQDTQGAPTRPTTPQDQQGQDHPQ